MVTGFAAILLVGIAGAGIAELIRVGRALREGKPPKGREWLASAIYTLLGGGAVLYGWDTEKHAIEIATLGAAFPLLFSTAIGALTTHSANAPVTPGTNRTLADYLGSRFETETAVA
jgi:hypothetical protein